MYFTIVDYDLKVALVEYDLKVQHCLWIHCYNYGCEVFSAYILNSDTDLGDILDNKKNQDTKLKNHTEMVLHYKLSS